MDFWIRVAGLLRHRWVVVPAVLTATALGLLAYLATPKAYESTATMVLTTTEFGGTESRDPAAPADLTNPLLNFSDSLRTTSAILIQAMGTKDVSRQLGVRKPTTLVVDDGRTNPDLLGLNGPFLFISVKSASAEDARDIVIAAQEVMRTKLDDWQRSLGAPRRTFVSIADVVPPGVPEPDRSRATKLAVVAGLAGLVIVLAIAYAANLGSARRRRRAVRRRRATRSDHLGSQNASEAASAAPPPVVARPAAETAPGAARGPAATEDDLDEEAEEAAEAPVGDVVGAARRQPRSRLAALHTQGHGPPTGPGGTPPAPAALGRSSSTVRVVVVPSVVDLVLSREPARSKAESGTR
jgi:hypothetical protein